VFSNHKQSTPNKKSICERKRCCKTCRALLSGKNHDCSKRYCHTCKQNKATGHLCYMRPLKNVLHAHANNVLYIFYDFETTQYKTYSNTAKEHVPNLVYVQQFVQSARKSNTVVSIVIVAAGEGTHFGMIL